MRGITFIIKPVGDTCNLTCDYCYFRMQCGDRISTKISRAVLEKFTSEYLSLPQKRFDFVWHGGEPLLAGVEFFENALELQRTYRWEEQKIYNSIQTNATLLDKEWVSFLKENYFQVGVSLDGPEAIHNAYRCYPSGVGSFADVMRGISLLKEEEVTFAVLAVLTKQSLGHEEETFEFLLESGIHKFDLLPCITANAVGLRCSIAPSEFAESTTRTFDMWWRLDNPKVRVRLFESVIRGILGGKQNVCKFIGACASYCTLDYNGDVYPCDNFVGVNDFVFGNVAESNLTDILNSEVRQHFIAQTQALPSGCINCEWRDICNGGCTYHRYMRRGRLADRSNFCGFRKKFFQHVQERVDEARRQSYCA